LGFSSVSNIEAKIIGVRAIIHTINVEEWERLAKVADFHPARLALCCSISQRQLQRIFKRAFQKSPSQWLREKQCQLGKQLISSGYSTKAAASELKFASESHFCREFKKVFGVSPQAFAPTCLLIMSLMDNNVAKGQSFPFAPTNHFRQGGSTSPAKL
jgi:AraC-like DNA-binding protein